jgi:hypothetical protein
MTVLKRTRQGLFAAALLLATSAVLAAELYVSKAGYDSASGSLQRPLRTIARAAALARPGTTVYIRAGVYYEQVITRVAGLEGQPVLFRNYGTESVTLDGSRLTAESDAGREQNRGVFELRHQWNVLQGLTIRNSPYSGVVLGASNLVVERNTITDTRRHAISTDTRYQSVNTAGMIRNATISRNTVARAPKRGLGYGQAISLIADGFVVDGNHVYDCYTEGIDVWLGAKNGVVTRNHVHHNVRTGIYLDGVTNVDVWGNRVHDNGVWTNGTVPGETNGHGIGVASENAKYATRNVRVFNNLAYRNKKTGIFVWDSASNPGYRGSQDVLIAYNTVVQNTQSAFYLKDGISNTGEVVSNLYDGSSPWSADMDVHGNIRLLDLNTFADASRADFHLTSLSPAINSSVPFRFPAFSTRPVTTDFDGVARTAPADAGAFQHVAP